MSLDGPTRAGFVVLSLHRNGDQARTDGRQPILMKSHKAKAKARTSAEILGFTDSGESEEYILPR